MRFNFEDDFCARIECSGVMYVEIAHKVVGTLGFGSANFIRLPQKCVHLETAGCAEYYDGISERQLRIIDTAVHVHGGGMLLKTKRRT